MPEPIIILDNDAAEPSIDELMTDEVKNRLIEFIQFLFSRSDNYRWVDDEVESKISISDIYPEKENVEQKPAIVVRRDNMLLTNRGIGHFHSWTFSKNFGSRFMDMLRSQVVIECYSREGLEAEKLANMVFMGILFFRRQLREVGRVHDILAAGIGPEIPQRVTSEITLAMVPVQVSFTFTEQWCTEEIGETLFNKLAVTTVIRDR